MRTVAGDFNQFLHSRKPKIIYTGGNYNKRKSQNSWVDMNTKTYYHRKADQFRKVKR